MGVCSQFCPSSLVLCQAVFVQILQNLGTKISRFHIVFVCIKICAIKWTIKCPFVIFIGLQCCKMLKAFIFSFVMTKIWSSAYWRGRGHKSWYSQQRQCSTRLRSKNYNISTLQQDKSHLQHSGSVNKVNKVERKSNRKCKQVGVSLAIFYQE